MILGFKPQFKQAILDGTKIHTIRKGNRWKPGMKIQMATGVRTKNYDCFKEAVCLGVQTIEIKWKDFEFFGKAYHYPFISIDGVNYTVYTVEDLDIYSLLAKNDGFEDIDSFLNWFNEDFEGQIIHWTDFKY